VAGIGLLAWLLFTVPGTNQARWTAPDPFNPESTVTFVECSGGDSTRDVDSIRVYRWSVTGGIAQRVAGKSVRGREWLPDSVQVDEGPGAHFWVAAVDTAGNESCASPVVYVGPVTAAEVLPEKTDPIVFVRVFTVRGELAGVRWPGDPPGRGLASGVYFLQETHRSGRVTRSRVVIVR